MYIQIDMYIYTTTAYAQMYVCKWRTNDTRGYVFFYAALLSQSLLYLLLCVYVCSLWCSLSLALSLGLFLYF